MTALAPALLAAALWLVPVGSAKTRLLAVSADTGTNSRSGREEQRVLPTSTRRMSWLVSIATGFVVAAAFDGGMAGIPAGFAAVGVAQYGYSRWRRHRRRDIRADPLACAAGWDLFSAGMRAGLPVPVTVRAVAAEFTGPAADALREVAGLLELGADPVSAWELAMNHPDTAELARAARRTARTGSGLAEVAADLAAQARAVVGEYGQARAQRATVWISAPLGLCFLPAFLCLGILPVVLGMVGRLTSSW